MPSNTTIPADLDAERALLGSLLMAYHLRPRDEAQAIGRAVAHIIAPSDLWGIRHRNIYKAIRRLEEQGKPADSLLIIECLRKQGLSREEASRYATYLGQIWMVVCTCEHAEYYAEIIHDWALRRATITDAGQMAKDAWVGKPQIRGIAT